jgi:hypothetical protein
MALDHVREFLEQDLIPELTCLHVSATQLQTMPDDRAPVEAMVAVPGRLIAGAQALLAQLEPHDAALKAKAEAKPKPRAR